MRIISKFHDYYDCVGAYDYDKTILYYRNTEEYRLYIDDIRLLRGRGDLNFKTSIIGFAGKVYPIIRYLPSHNCEEIILTNEDEINDFCKNKSKQRYTTIYELNKSNVVDFLIFYKQKNRYEYLFEKFNTGIWQYNDFLKTNKNEKNFFINPRLNQVNFFRVLDPHSAYQELRMYWEAKAQPLKPIPELSDEVMAASKGHDGKYSFRKPPKK